MFFVWIAWLLTLLTFLIWLRALHTIPIHTHTPLQRDSQKLQLQNLLFMTKLLLSFSLGLLALHFTLSDEIDPSTPFHAEVGANASTLSLHAVVTRIHNSSG